MVALKITDAVHLPMSVGWAIGPGHEIIAGVHTVKGSALLALPVERVTEILPVVAVAGTRALTLVALTNVGGPAETPLKATSVVSSRSVPLMVT